MDAKKTEKNPLERPERLKKWSQELVGILNGQESELFGEWDFRGSLTRKDLGNILTKVRNCGSLVELRSSFDKSSGEIGDPVVHAANYCGQHTICPYCAGRVQDRRGARFREPILAAARQYAHAYMITATIPPVETWREDLNLLVSGWQNLRRMGQKRTGRRSQKSRGEWGKVEAALAKVELKRGSGSRMPHCHYHALVFTNEPMDYRVWDAEEKKKSIEDRIPRYRIPSSSDPRGWVPGSKLSYEWYQATEGRATNIRVDPLRYRPEHKKRGMSYEESIFEQSREVLKYATKFDSHPEKGHEKIFARDFVDIRDATYNRRLFMAYGAFRAIGGDDFIGGGPHISEDPIIWESRWRGNYYSPLKVSPRPIFPNSDKTESVSQRLRILNAVQGQIRRMRSAILGSRNHYRDTGELRPAYYARREYLPEGGYKEWPMALEVPQGVAMRPDDSTAWEAWIDRAMEIGKHYYGSLRDELEAQGRERLWGSPEEQSANEFYIRQTTTYQDELIELFRRTILDSQAALLASQVPAPP